MIYSVGIARGHYDKMFFKINNKTCINITIKDGLAVRSNLDVITANKYSFKILFTLRKPKLSSTVEMALATTPRVRYVAAELSVNNQIAFTAYYLKLMERYNNIKNELY